MCDLKSFSFPHHFGSASITLSSSEVDDFLFSFICATISSWIPFDNPEKFLRKSSFVISSSSEYSSRSGEDDSAPPLFAIYPSSYAPKWMKGFPLSATGFKHTILKRRLRWVQRYILYRMLRWWRSGGGVGKSTTKYEPLGVLDSPKKGFVRWKSDFLEKSSKNYVLSTKIGKIGFSRFSDFDFLGFYY